MAKSSQTRKDKPMPIGSDRWAKHLIKVNPAFSSLLIGWLACAATLAVGLTWHATWVRMAGSQWWIWAVLICTSLATGLHALERVLRTRIETWGPTQPEQYHRFLQQAAEGMMEVDSLEHLLQLTVHLMTMKVRCRYAAIYLWDKRMQQFVLAAQRQWNLPNPPIFGKTDPLIEFMWTERRPIATRNLQRRLSKETIPLDRVVRVLKELQAAALIPSFRQDRCIGFLLLGEKRSGLPYHENDIRAFEILSAQAALAIEHARFCDEFQYTQLDLYRTAKMASLGHMAGGLGHQVNNRFHVLVILAGTLRILMEEKDPETLSPEQRRFFWDRTLGTLRKIEEQALQGGETVKTLLKLARTDGEYKPLDVRQIIKTAKDVVRFRIDMGQMEIVEDLPDALPKVYGDLYQLADCCLNLMAYAFDATRKKAEMIRLNRLTLSPQDPSPYRGRLKIRAYQDRRHGKDVILMELADNGIGMTPDELERLFAPFSIAKGIRPKGTDLSLYVIHRIVEQHGGAIFAESQWGVGTTFTLQLPIAPELESKEKRPTSDVPQSP
jgi:signal transduction histidine kinase